MQSETQPSAIAGHQPKAFAVKKARTRFFGLTLDECIRVFFGGNAFVAVIVLALITFFLFREGGPFFKMNRDSIRVYRVAGLEYVDIIRQQEQDHTALTRYLFDIRMKVVKQLRDERGGLIEADLKAARLTVEKLLSNGAAAGAPELIQAQMRVDEFQKADSALTLEINASLAAFDKFAERYGDTVLPVRGLVSDIGEVATGIKSRYTENEDYKVARAQYLAAGKKTEADAIVLKEIDFKTEVAAITAIFPTYQQMNQEFAVGLKRVVNDLPILPVPALQPRMVRFSELTDLYLAGFPETEVRLKAWDQLAPVPWYHALAGFIFGKQWLTASFWQDWYGVVPLFVGSLMVSMIALAIAVPLGVGAAVYINQIASSREQRLIKPAIEFISAIPSVVLGFFGIAVLGQSLRALSQVEALSWIPGFPYSERLNALTAGVLLALIAVPTIFTLAEDAINNVPRAFKEASFALGASKMQTIIRIIVPAALSGIISAVLLGLGRVIGETMVVLLCAGNRIAIPDFTAGLAVAVQPVHTMTGIIAQEMGEVVRGSIHYRALFVVGLVLFFIAMLINFLAQKIVRKYRISVG
ncbi:phosphate ABC transporter permease [Verrucomicrobia bacterium IMCC26134]|nr:phosphate ABC transporter permease [Verrucomicrobia bacterium IMCC26134]